MILQAFDLNYVEIQKIALFHVFKMLLNFALKLNIKKGYVVLYQQQAKKGEVWNSVNVSAKKP